MTRYTAFATHLLISLLVVGTLLGLSILLWYPSPLFEIDGGWQGLRIVALVDLVLGPVLTLVVFRPGKPGLRMDMAVIVSIQVAALSYGIWTLHHNRPALMVYADDVIKPIAFSVVEEIDPQGDLLRRYGDELPVRLALPIPTDPEAGSDYLLQRVFSPTPLHLHIDDYVRLSAWWPGVIADSLDITHYVQQDPAWRRQLERTIAQLQRPVEKLVFLPIEGRNKSGIIVADAASGDFVGYLDIPYVPHKARRNLTVRERLQNRPGPD
jgi:hypothetical protein